jgi:translocation and assembly module TamB
VIRRLRVALYVTLAMGAAALVLVVGGGTLLLRTDTGRAWVQARVERSIKDALGDSGDLALHGLRFVPLGRVRLDSLTLRAADGAPMLTSGALEISFAIAPLLDREIHLRAVRIERPYLALVQDTSGAWNIAQLGAAPDSAALAERERRAPQPWRVRLDTLTLAAGTASITRPDSLPALPPRQSIVREIAIALGATDVRTDGSRGTMTLAHLAFAADDPPIAMRRAHGSVSLAGDSLQLDLPEIQLDGARLALAGAIGWGNADADTRFDLLVRADTVDLRALAWASDLVPAEGRASAIVRITNAPARGVMRYTVTAFDVAATASRLRGRLVADVGDDLAIRDLDATASPLDLRLVRELFGDSSPPPPWDGTVSGRVLASGGPLARWRLDPSTLEFTDRRIGGARSRFTIAGVLDLSGEPTSFGPLSVGIDSMDVRTAGGVTEVADSLRGFLAGRVELRGPLDNIRFSALELVHTDGTLPRSVVRGDGRIASDTATTWLEARLALDTVGVAALGRAFTPEVLQGRMHGTLDVSARGDSVALDLALSGEGADVGFVGATSLDSARLVLQGNLSVWALDLRRILPELTLPAHRITAHARLGIDGPAEEPTGPVRFVIDSTSVVAGISLREGLADLVLEPGGIRVDTLVLAGPIGRADARGRLSRDPALRDTLRFSAALDSAALLRGFLSDSLAESWADSLGGRAQVSGIALGSLDTLDVRMLVTADSLWAGSYRIGRLESELLLDGVPSATRGLATFDLTDGAGLGFPIHRLSAEATVRDAKWADASLRLLAADTLQASARADFHFMGDSVEIRLDSLDATTRDARWTLLRSTGMFSGPDRFVVDSLELRSREGARFAVNARFDSVGTVAMRAEATRIPLAHARFTGLMPERVNGLLSLDATLSGTRGNPLLALTAALDSTYVDGIAAPDVAVEGSYEAREAQLAMRGRGLGREVFTVTAELPLDLALEERALKDRLIQSPLYVRLVADASPLSGFHALMPGVRELQGGIDADVQVTGQWDALEPRGIILVREGAFAVPALGTGFREVLADISLAPDSVIIQRARLADERSLNDTASVEGVIVSTPGGWRTDVRTVARDLRVIDNPRVAEADVSWNLRLRGALDSLRLGGDITVPSANVYIGQQQRRVLQLEEDVTAADEAAKYAPTLEGLRLRLGNEVRLRSPEANVQLTGEINVVGTLDAPDVRGEIYAARGSYRLNLGLLQRTFQVDSGLVRMAGPLSIPPTLDIYASYLVRQADREDVQINARITGTVEEPRLVLSSNNLGTTASETEIISYLLFGAPSFVLDGQSASAVRLATAALVPSIGGAAERALGAQLPFLSELQVVTVAGDSPRDFTLNSFDGLLNSFALTAGTQIGTDSYLRLSGGVCRGANPSAQSLPAWFGIAGEYRPRERLSAEISLTPGSSPCNRIGTFSQIYQLGLDLYRDWRW